MGVSQLFDTFLCNSPDKGPPELGEFYWVPTPDLAFHVLETRRATPQAHTQVDFTLAQFSSAKHYRAKEHLPVKLLHIDEGSEALLFKSKMRPCLVLGSAIVKDCGSLKNGQDQRMASVLGHASYLVAPLNSANSPSKPSGPFPPQMVARIKMLWYPHLMWVPRFDGTGVGSILRLDRIFPTQLGVGMARCGKRLHEDVLDLVIAQAAEVLGIPLDTDTLEHLKATKELLQQCKPADLA